MTALDQFAKLESLGIWRPEPDAQRREVVVSFGDATLIIRDSADRPLAHWSLPAVVRMNPGSRPAIFAPDEDGTETIEIDDDLMIDAIEKVRKAVNRSRPRPGRLRGVGAMVSIAAVVGLGVFWAPNALRDHTLNAVTEATRSAIGATLLGHVQRLTGAVCDSPRGALALNTLKERALGADTDVQVLIVPDAVSETLVLPGGIILLNRSLVEDYEDPAVPAGYIIAANQARIENDPLGDVLNDAGIRATFQLLTTGEMSSDILRTYAEHTVGQSLPAISTEQLLARFEAAQVSSRPFAYAIDITGESTLALIEANPVNPTQAPLILGDGDWVALQGICGN